MAPEVLIVGDTARRAELLARIQELGYEAAICSAASLTQRIARGQIPSAVVVCTDDVEPGPLMAELRRTRRGSGVPVTLHGPLGGRIGDLADVLDLGADHFLEAPASDQQIAAALEELVGPGAGRVVRSPPRVNTGPLPVVSHRRDGASGQTDVVLGQLHRTLDMLEARLKEREAGEGDDDLDLAALGFEALPDVGEPAPDDSGSSLELSRPTTTSVRGRAPRPRRREPTERLREEADPPSRAAVEPSVSRARPSRAALPVDERGTLDRIEVPRLLWVLHRGGFSGALRLRHGRVEKRAWWADGAMLFVDSNVGHDRLVDGLLHRGLLTREQYGQARRLADADPRRAAARLVEQGLLKPGEMTRVLQQHLVRVIDSTFAWSDGDFELRPDEACAERPLAEVPVSRIVAEGVRHRMEAERLEALLGGLHRYPRLRPERGPLRPLADELLLSPSEESWLPRLDGARSLRELLEQPQADELELLGLVYVLRVLDRLDMGDERVEPEVGGDPAAIDIERIRDRLHRAREADYFAVLGLPRDAGRIDVRRAHADLRRTFGDEAIEAPVRQALREELAELRDLVDEARDVLVDDGLRSAYLAHLEDA